MAIFKNLFKKEFFTGYFYVIDLPTLREYLERSCRFAKENNLESAAELYLYLGGEKHLIGASNQSAGLDDDMPGNGFLFSFDEFEYASLDTMIRQKLSFLPPYFKINLPDGSDVWLNEYKKNHPELKVEDY